MDWQTLRLKETMLGKDHPSTLGSMNNLALSLAQQGKYAETEAIEQSWNETENSQVQLDRTRQKKRKAGDGEASGAEDNYS